MFCRRHKWMPIIPVCSAWRVFRSSRQLRCACHDGYNDTLCNHNIDECHGMTEWRYMYRRREQLLLWLCGWLCRGYLRNRFVARYNHYHWLCWPSQFRKQKSSQFLDFPDETQLCNTAFSICGTTTCVTWKPCARKAIDKPTTCISHYNPIHQYR